jgi:hypothetical protein
MLMKTVNSGWALLLAALVSAGAAAQDIAGSRVAQSGVLVNVGSRLCADLAQSSSREGVNIQLGDCRSGLAAWDLVELGQNDYAIVNRASRQVLDVQGGSRDDGANVQQWTWNGSGAQRWAVQSIRGAYQFINRQSGKCLEVQGRAANPGANIAQYRCTSEDNQLWRLDPVAATATADPRGYIRPADAPVVAATAGGRPAGRTLYTGMIHSRATGKCVDVEGASNADGADVRQWSCNGTNAQLWDVVDVGRNEVALVVLASNKVMEVVGGARHSGADVVQNRWTGGPNQRWRMEPVEGGFSRFVNSGSGKCLDLDAARTADGVNIAQYECHYGENQQWRMEIRSTGSNWSGYRPEQNWAARQGRFQQEPPAFLIGDFKGFNNFYQSNIQLSIYSDGVVIATLDGGQKVLGYYRGDQIFLGNGRFDVEQERTGFRLSPSGQGGNPVSYQRLRYESPARGR